MVYDTLAWWREAKPSNLMVHHTPQHPMSLNEYVLTHINLPLLKPFIPFINTSTGYDTSIQYYHHGVEKSIAS